MRDIIRDENGEIVLPAVYTEQSTYQPESVHKHSWGIVMLFDGYKTCLPWERVRSIKEPVGETNDPADAFAFERVY